MARLELVEDGGVENNSARRGFVYFGDQREQKDMSLACGKILPGISWYSRFSHAKSW